MGDPTFMDANQASESVTSYLNQSKKILIVEDNFINSAILSSILEEQYEIIVAENGEEALKKMEQYGDQIVLVLLDIIMPVMDGYTFMSKLKKDPRFSGTPVIVTTSNDSDEDEIQALSLGATDYVRKPYRPEIVKHRVTSIINLRETSAMVNAMKFDRLTGLYSKEYFYSQAEELTKKFPDKRFDIICCDIENFSMINEMFGHEVGNELLLHVASILSDIASEGGLCCRLDADTFALLLEHTQEYTTEWFQNYIEQLNILFERYRLHLDFGIYPMDEDDISINVACDRALYALQTIKHNFDHCFAYYDDSIRQEKLRAQSIIDAMDDALANKEFVLYYQPKYDLKSETIVGAEALVRWISPTKGFMPPNDFIPVFEQNGLIGRLDEYVWEEACAFIRRCLDKNIPIVPVSINVSRSDLFNPLLQETFLNLIAKYNLEPSQLHLEITESVCIERPDEIIKSISQLRNHGFVIEMDDFGSGYSSLNMLSTLPIDILKLDMKFIQNISVDEKEKGIIRFVINLAKWMDLTVIAEGAETQSHVDELRASDCDQVQGYFYSRPLPESDFEALIIEKNS